MTKLKLWLYIAGRGAQSQRAIENLRSICESTLNGAAYEVEVIDVLEQPDRAESDSVLATPTLIKRSDPVRRLVGDLSDRHKVLLGLDLEQLGPQS
jgi:circadian clock protein KaiB